MVTFLIFLSLSVFLAAAMLTGTFLTLSKRTDKRTLGRLTRVAASGEARVTEELPDIRKAEFATEAVTWLNKFLADLKILPRVKMWLFQANFQMTLDRIIVACACCALAGGFVIYLRSGFLGPAVIVGVASGTLPLAYIQARRGARMRAFREKLPETLELLVGALRAGHSITSAINVAAVEAPAPLRNEFRQCADEQKFGIELRATLQQLMVRVPVPDLQIAVTAIMIQQEAGGNLAEVLEKVADIMRQRSSLQSQIRAHTAQGRLTGYLLAAAPIIIGIGEYFLDPQSLSILWTHPMGIKLLWGAGILTTIGVFAINRIVGIKV